MAKPPTTTTIHQLTGVWSQVVGTTYSVSCCRVASRCDVLCCPELSCKHWETRRHQSENILGWIFRNPEKCSTSIRQMLRGVLDQEAQAPKGGRTKVNKCFGPSWGLVLNFWGAMCCTFADLFSKVTHTHTHTSVFFASASGSHERQMGSVRKNWGVHWATHGLCSGLGKAAVGPLGHVRTSSIFGNLTSGHCSTRVEQHSSPRRQPQDMLAADVCCSAHTSASVFELRRAHA